MKEINYNVTPDALKTIESKLRQMQATGANITPEMMSALYESVLEVGANKAGQMAEIETRSMENAANRAQRDKEVDQVLKSRQEEGIGSLATNAVLYGGKYANEKGYLDPLKFWNKPTTPGGTTTPTGIKTVMGNELGTSPGATKPSVMAGENLLGDRGTAGLELSPQPTPQTGAVASVTPETPTIPSTGGVVSGSPTTTSTAPTGGLPTSAPMGELTSSVTPPSLNLSGLPTPPGSEAITELMPATGNLMVPPAETLIPSTIADVVTPGLEAGVEAGTELGAEGLSAAVPSLGLSALSTPFAAGGFAGGIMKATGVSDDVGKVILFGQGGENEQNIAGGVAGGAAAGAAMGSVVPIVGTAVGAIIGGIAGGLSNADVCIIVTCCHGRHSPEVNVAREYRDKFMSSQQIRGYYVLAEATIPYLIKHNLFRERVKSQLVDRLIRYGRWALGKPKEEPGILDYIVTKGFLGACSIAGLLVPEYRRQTGEVY